jgi:hypothetical protein
LFFACARAPCHPTRGRRRLFFRHHIVPICDPNAWLCRDALRSSAGQEATDVLERRWLPTHRDQGTTKGGATHEHGSPRPQQARTARATAGAGNYARA